MDFPRLGVLLNAEYSAAELIRLGVLAEELGYRSFMYVDVANSTANAISASPAWRCTPGAFCWRPA